MFRVGVCLQSSGSVGKRREVRRKKTCPPQCQSRKKQSLMRWLPRTFWPQATSSRWSPHLSAPERSAPRRCPWAAPRGHRGTAQSAAPRSSCPSCRAQDMGRQTSTAVSLPKLSEAMKCGHACGCIDVQTGERYASHMFMQASCHTQYVRVPAVKRFSSGACMNARAAVAVYVCAQHVRK